MTNKNEKDGLFGGIRAQKKAVAICFATASCVYDMPIKNGVFRLQIF